MTAPVRIGIIGMGGFAGVHHDTVAALEAEGEFRLVAACDPAMDAFAARAEALRFAERGVRCFTDYRALLDACASDLDMVTIPTPIPLHAPMHRAAVAHGLAVYLEKPPTLDARELEAMIAADTGRFRTNVGFNFIVEPERQALKARLVAGEFGPVRRVAVYALWPRNAAYFARAPWAGRLQLDGRLVLDSCIGNAMAHQVHDGLFWCGDAPWAWGAVTRVAAELYRAHPIEGMDTAFLNVAAGGVALDIAMSHACTGDSRQEERVQCADAEIRYHIYGDTAYEIRWADGRVETGPRTIANLVAMNFRAYAAYLRGEADRPLTTLADSRPFVHLNDLAYLAAGRITPVQSEAQPDGHRAVAGLPEAVARFVDTGIPPSAQGVPWAAPGGTATPADLPRLEATVLAMAGVTA
jgi:predicted dehydrogenase